MFRKLAAWLDRPCTIEYTGAAILAVAIAIMFGYMLTTVPGTNGC